jgi:hypothetical protein
VNARAFNYFATIRFKQDTEESEGCLKNLKVSKAVYLVDQGEMSEVFER